MLWGPERALRVAACLLLAACCLLARRAPPWCPNNLINRLKFYKLQLGDPNPNPAAYPLRRLARPPGHIEHRVRPCDQKPLPAPAACRAASPAAAAGGPYDPAPPPKKNTAFASSPATVAMLSRTADDQMSRRPEAALGGWVHGAPPDLASTPSPANVAVPASL